MRIRHVWTGLGATLLLFAGAASPAAASTLSAASTPATIAPADWLSLTQCSTENFHGDARLGPLSLPILGQVGAELIGYRRTGNLTPQRFLDTYYDPSANSGSGGWRYPPDNGYADDPTGHPIKFALPLSPGQEIDRFGSEHGSFLAPAGLRYAQRSIPPQSLDANPAGGCNYHDYLVLRPFTVRAGPIAAWFGQPGGGLQYQLDPTLMPGGPSPLNVGALVAAGYLARQ
jgi:hypothetical protein